MWLLDELGLDWPIWLAGARSPETPPEGTGLLLRMVEVLLLAAVDPDPLPELVATGKRRRGREALCGKVRLLL